METIHDLEAGREAVVRGRYGVIEVVDETFAGLQLRPFPKIVSLPDMRVFGDWFTHKRLPGNRCRLYYNQPRRFPQFLVLKYVVSRRDTTLASFQLSLRLLDQVAAIKGSDALLCDAANLRISDRLMRRYGWQPHAKSRWHRNFIKRLYETPACKAAAAQPLYK